MKAGIQEMEIYDVFPALKKHDTLYAGVFDSAEYPYVPAPPVRCNYYSAFLIVKGTGFIITDNQEFAIQPGRVFTFNDRQVIGWSRYENTTGLVIACTAPVALELRLRFNKPYADIPDDAIQYISSIFMECVNEFRRNDTHTKKVLRAAIAYLNALFGRLSGAPDVHDEVVTALRNKVCADFSENHSVETIASALHIHPKLLNERCVKCLGITAKQYILDLKLTEAKRLLAFSSFNTAGIASCTGFEDPSYFTRLFKKKTGFTPTAFKEKYQIK